MLTEDDKNRARHHAGYLAVQESQTFVLGIPAAVQTQFVIEGAFNRILPSGEAMFRRFLDNCDQLEQQILDNADTLVASEVGDIKLRPDEFPQLVKRYRWFVNSFCNLLGIRPNPFDARFYGSSAGGVNVAVMHG